MTVPPVACTSIDTRTVTCCSSSSLRPIMSLISAPAVASHAAETASDYCSRAAHRVTSSPYDLPDSLLIANPWLSFYPPQTPVSDACSHPMVVPKTEADADIVSVNQYVTKRKANGQIGPVRKTKISKKPRKRRLQADPIHLTAPLNIRAMHTNQSNGRYQIWFFILKILMNPERKHLAVWTGTYLSFRIVDRAMFTKLWSEHNGRNRMIAWTSVCRAIRLCYGDKGIITPVSQKDHIWAFVADVSIPLKIPSQELVEYIEQHHVPCVFPMSFTFEPKTEDPVPKEEPISIDYHTTPDCQQYDWCNDHSSTLHSLNPLNVYPPPPSPTLNSLSKCDRVGDSTTPPPSPFLSSDYPSLSIYQPHYSYHGNLLKL